MKFGPGQRNCAVCKLNEGIPGNIQLKLCKTPPTMFNEYLCGKICSRSPSSPHTDNISPNKNKANTEIKYVQLKTKPDNRPGDQET